MALFEVSEMMFGLEDMSNTIKQNKERGVIPTSKQLSGLELRVSNIHVKDNGTKGGFLKADQSNLYVLVVVIDDKNPQATHSLKVDGFPRVLDDESLPLDRTLYYWQQSEQDKVPPSQIHAMISVMKSRAGVRKFGNLLTTLNENLEDSNVLQDSIKTVLSGGVTNITQGLSKVGNLVGKLLTDVQDKPLFTCVQSFTALGEDFDQVGRVMKKAFNRHVDCEMTLFVRDAERLNV